MTNILGNAADAALALSGFGLIGEGSSRNAYLVNGVVYKVERRDGWRDPNGNMMEWNSYNSTSLWDCLPEGCAIPVTNMFTVGDRNIIAMEYIKPSKRNDDVIAQNEAMRILENAGYCDIHPGNFVINDDAIWLIDFEV